MLLQWLLLCALPRAGGMRRRQRSAHALSRLSSSSFSPFRRSQLRAAAQHTAGFKASAMESFAFAPAKNLFWVALALASSAGPRLAAANNLPSDDAKTACLAWADLQQSNYQQYYRAGCNNYISQGGTLTACKAWCSANVRSAPPRVGC